MCVTLIRELSMTSRHDLEDVLMSKQIHIVRSFSIGELTDLSQHIGIVLIDRCRTACQFILCHAASNLRPLMACAILSMVFALATGNQVAASTPNLSCPVCRGPDTAPNPGQFNFFFLVRYASDLCS